MCVCARARAHTSVSAFVYMCVSVYVHVFVCVSECVALYGLFWFVFCLAREVRSHAVQRKRHRSQKPYLNR